MKSWLHRISHHAEVSYPLLELGLLSIGFSELSSYNFVSQITAHSGWQVFENHFEKQGHSKPKSRYSLWRFLNEMKKGDNIIVPSWGVFSIYELTEDTAITISEIEIDNLKDWHENSIERKGNGFLYNIKGEVVDLGFFRKIKLIKKDIPRNEFADSALTSRMKIRSTNTDISDLNESIKEALGAFEKNEPINVHSHIISKTYLTILEILRNKLNPNKFETLIKWYFQRVGASDAIIPSKNEKGKQGDADIIAIFEPLRTVVYVQAKFHTGETPSWAIEQIKNYQTYKEVMDDGYSKISWVVSLADNFSKESYSLAKEAKIQLLDGKQFTKMLLEAGFTNLDKIF